MAFEQVYGPIDLGRRVDVAAAVIASALANIHRDPKKRRKAYTPADFMPKWDAGGQRPGRSSSDMLEMVKMLNTAFGGQDMREPDGDVS